MMPPDTYLALNRVIKSADDFGKALTMMNSRMADRSLCDGDGFVCEIWDEATDDYEPTLAVMPWRLYAALRNGLSYNPSAVDPDILRRENELDDDQLTMLRAFMKLELGFADFDPLPAPSTKRQHVRLRKRLVE